MKIVERQERLVSREYKQKHYSENKEEIIKAIRKWEKEDKKRNPEKYKERNRVKNRKHVQSGYYRTEEYKEKFGRKANRKRRAKEKEVIEKFTDDEWAKMKRDTGGICPKCKTKTTDKNPMTLDHIIPVSKATKGLVYTIDDVQPLCKKCNASKGNKII